MGAVWMGDEIKQFEGSCHCGAVKYNIQLNIERLLRCNCSICSKLGSLWAFGKKADMELTAGGLDSLSTYQFGAKKLTHNFCKNCGVETHADGIAPDGTPTVGVNVRTLDDMDLEGYEIFDYDGASL